MVSVSSYSLSVVVYGICQKLTVLGLASLLSKYLFILQNKNYRLFIISENAELFIMALLKLAGVWEKFILKDLTTVAKYAKVELLPPGPGDLVGAVKGVGKLTGDAITFKWAQVLWILP